VLVTKLNTSYIYGRYCTSMTSKDREIYIYLHSINFENFYNYNLTHL